MGSSLEYSEINREVLMALRSKCLWVVALQAHCSEFRKKWEGGKKTWGAEPISKLLWRDAEK